MVVKRLNPSVERKSTSTFQVEGVQICTLPTNNIEGLNRSTNNNIQTFRHVSLPEGLNSTKKHDLDKKWATFFYPPITINKTKQTPITINSLW
jgi:hypothetical protein